MVMFILTTLHIAINLYVWLTDEIDSAVYMGNFSRWDAITHYVLSTVTTFLGDYLVIYRCYIVWGNNLLIVILPIALVITATVLTGIAEHKLFQLHLNTNFHPSQARWIDRLYAIGFTQNTMTTCLIVYRIWQQDRMSRSIISSSFRLAIVMRIIVESASLYLFNVLILIILYACNSNGQFVAQEALVPVCGIAFALITVRLSLHTSTSVETTQNPGTKIEFTTMPGTAAVSHLTTTTDQPTVADLVVKQAVRINGDVHHALTSDG